MNKTYLTTRYFKDNGFCHITQEIFFILPIDKVGKYHNNAINLVNT